MNERNTPPKETAPVSVIIPTWRRPDQLSVTLESILACIPVPEEILVHVDAGDNETPEWLQRRYPKIRVLSSTSQVGPGGGRNKLVRAARHEIVASFDDDSYPLERDYFRRLVQLFQEFPDATVVASAIFLRGEVPSPDRKRAGWTTTFIGCGCAYRKSVFSTLAGYLELPIAYGAEETDLTIQLMEKNRRVLYTDWLRVFHDTEYSHHETPPVNGAKIGNLALLAYVRYPVSMWGYAILQVFNRVAFAIRNGRYAGVFGGLCSIPGRIWSFRYKRRPVSRAVLTRYLKARSTFEPVPWPPSLCASPESSHIPPAGS